MRKNADTVFVALLLALLLGAFIKTVFFPKALNLSENRYAQKLPALSYQGFLSGDLQKDAEAAFSDQLPFSEAIVAQTNKVKNRVTLSLFSYATEDAPAHYYVYNAERALDDPAAANVLFFRDRLCYAPKKLEVYQVLITARADALNAIFCENENVAFYAYFVENDANIDFETGENCGICDAVLSALELPQGQKSAFRLTGFDDFCRDFYLTDHHWNDQGVRRAYRELAELLELGEPIAPTNSAVLENRLVGSKAKAIGAQELMSEEVTVSVYSLPEAEVFIDGKPGTYGNEAKYLSGLQEQALTYGAYYGGDEGEVIFKSTGREDAGNLLIIGDSYDNALLKLLASHYNCTYCVDPRYYAQAMGEEFSLSAYIEANHIDTVLFIGSVSFWTLDDFAVEG